MNKTVNINLGGMFFHIDEDAYQKLTRYFDAIKRSLNHSSGQDEIIKDIEIVTGSPVISSFSEVVIASGVTIQRMIYARIPVPNPAKTNSINATLIQTASIPK